MTMKYDRVYNFSAGPSMLPLEVLEKVQAELLNYAGSGQSVMEMSHRSKEFIKIAEDAEANLRKLLNIPDNYAMKIIGHASDYMLKHYQEIMNEKTLEVNATLLTFIEQMQPSENENATLKCNTPEETA